MQALSAAGVVIVFLYGGRLVLRGEITPGGLVAVFSALQRLSWPLMALGFVVGMVAARPGGLRAPHGDLSARFPMS